MGGLQALLLEDAPLLVTHGERPGMRDLGTGLLSDGYLAVFLTEKVLVSAQGCATDNSAISAVKAIAKDCTLFYANKV
jgi:hypothetical protein